MNLLLRLNTFPIILLLVCLTSFSTNAKSERFVLAFGSCVHQDKPQPIWSAIIDQQPDVFMLLGDNVYGDTEDMALLKQKYDKQAAHPEFKKLRQQSKLIGIWDDHDFGQNDAGAEYPMKSESKALMLDFFEEPFGNARYQRTDGAYTSYIFGQYPHRVQVILVDLRWNRTPLNAVSENVYKTGKVPNNMGPYLPIEDPKATMLGENQWQWLEKQLQKSAEVRIFASSLQYISEFTGWESWANFPHERTRFMDLLDKHEIDNLLVVSGDTHWGELSTTSTPKGYPLWEMTSSGLTEKWHQISPNKHRLGRGYANANFGQINVTWPQLNEQPIKVELNLKDVNGGLLKQQHLLF